ncbi:WD_REPEATS_REGION domain-containing protein [Psidium guajava]|nr:WD_REPEATS_REGION domain-containing protein [Psidium guajava]
MKLLVAPALLLCSLLLSFALLGPSSATSQYCGSKCEGRCARAGVMDRCIKYCNICCEECRCVPSGTYGNKHECPCYRDKRSSKGRPKCP